MLFRRTWNRINIPYRYRQLRNYLVSNRILWQKGLSEEIDYWQDIIGQVGKSDNIYVKHFEKRLRARQQTLTDKITIHLNVPAGETVKILDVGAGPLTQLGTRWEDREVEIIAIDPLADAYNQAMSEAHLEPEIWTQPGKAEEIEQMFAPETFDVIYSRNALDHSFNPMAALKQAMTLLKSGGFIFLSHKVNEGKRIYGGLHQWNFCQESGEFIVWNMREKHHVFDELPALADKKIVEYDHPTGKMIDVWLFKADNI